MCKLKTRQDFSPLTMAWTRQLRRESSLCPFIPTLFYIGTLDFRGGKKISHGVQTIKNGRIDIFTLENKTKTLEKNKPTVFSLFQISLSTSGSLLFSRTVFELNYSKHDFQNRAARAENLFEIKHVTTNTLVSSEPWKNMSFPAFLWMEEKCWNCN